MNSRPFLELQRVSYSYPARKAGKREAQPVVALKQVTLQVRPGEYLAVLGHNGSGKSTLARLCNGLLVPDSGRVLVAGIDTRDEGRRRSIRDLVGMIFHDPDNQIVATAVEDDVAWALAVRGAPEHLIRERVAWAMAAAGIDDLREMPTHRLSGGQRQRLAIAGVLAMRPRCIIADEATAQLDPLSRAEITGVLHRLNRQHGLTIVQVTHLVEEAVLAQRVVVMQQGEVAAEGTPAALFADPERLRHLNVAIPEPIQLAARLRAAGATISPRALTPETIARELNR